MFNRTTPICWSGSRKEALGGVSGSTKEAGETCAHMVRVHFSSPSLCAEPRAYPQHKDMFCATTYSTQFDGLRRATLCICARDCTGWCAYKPPISFCNEPADAETPIAGCVRECGRVWGFACLHCGDLCCFHCKSVLRPYGVVRARRGMCGAARQYKTLWWICARALYEQSRLKVM